MSNEAAFEKWAIDYGLDYEPSFTRYDVEASWQAAIAYIQERDKLVDKTDTGAATLRPIDIKKLAEEYAFMQDSDDCYAFSFNALKQFAEAYAAKVHDKRVEELEAKNRELFASINDLREALEGALPWVVSQVVACHGMKCRESVCESCSGEDYAEEAANKAGSAHLKANQVLSKTPAQSLIEHNNEVIEICAKVCEESFVRWPMSGSEQRNSCAHAIRELKQEVK